MTDAEKLRRVRERLCFDPKSEYCGADDDYGDYCLACEVRHLELDVDHKQRMIDFYEKKAREFQERNERALAASIGREYLGRWTPTGPEPTHA